MANDDERSIDPVAGSYHVMHIEGARPVGASGVCLAPWVFQACCPCSRTSSIRRM